MLQRWAICSFVISLYVTTPAVVFAQTFAGKTVSEWKRNLDSKSGTVRRNAAFSLGKLGGSASIALPKLKELLEDEFEQVREAAAYAIGEIVSQSLVAQDDNKLVSVLRERFKAEKQQYVRRSLAVALGSMSTAAEDAIPDLEAAIDDPNASSLVRQNAAWALGQIGETGIGGLTRALSDSDELVRRDAAKAIAQFDPEVARKALDGLLTCCQTPDPEAKKAALQVLTKVLTAKDEKAIPILKNVLRQAKDHEIRHNAALALANIGGAKAADPAVDVLLTTLKNGTSTEKQQAAAALGKFGKAAAEAVPALRDVLQKDDRTMHFFAALALGGIGPPAKEAVNDLVTIAVNKNQTDANRKQACVALAEIGPCPAAEKAVPKLVAVWRDPNEPYIVRDRLYWALTAHGKDLANMPEVFDAAKTILEEPTRENQSQAKKHEMRMVRYYAAYLFALFKRDQAPKIAVDTLGDFLKDETFSLATGADTNVKGGGVETGMGGVSVKERSQGDARTMAVYALRLIGSDVVSQHESIIKQLRFLSQSKDTDPTLRKDAKTLLDSLQ